MKITTLHKDTCADYMARTRPRWLAESKWVANLLSTELQQGNTLSSFPGERNPDFHKKKTTHHLLLTGQLYDLMVQCVGLYSNGLLAVLAPAPRHAQMTVGDDGSGRGTNKT